MDGPSYYSKTPILNASDAVDVMRDVLKELDREWVCVVNMDNHLKPVNFNVVSIGSINLSLAPIQNILKSGSSATATISSSCITIRAAN
jgi:DNA repair protein RadC